MSLDTLELLKQMAGFLGAMMGPDTEVVIHDVPQDEIVYIVHGEVTGRTVGKTAQSPVIRLMDERARENGSCQLIGHQSKTKSAKTLRASNLFVHDENGALRYALCVNQNMDGLLQMQSFLDRMLCSEQSEPQPTDACMEDIVSSVIMAEIEREKPFQLDSREAKLSILKRLNEKGVFEVRGAVVKTCELLQIAQPTLYKYLKKLEQKD